MRLWKRSDPLCVSVCGALASSIGDPIVSGLDIAYEFLPIGK
jgi:hypothetical protein